jgi:hypothetical protein
MAAYAGQLERGEVYSVYMQQQGLPRGSHLTVVVAQFVCCLCSPCLFLHAYYMQQKCKAVGPVSLWFPVCVHCSSAVVNRQHPVSLLC